MLWNTNLVAVSLILDARGTQSHNASRPCSSRYCGAGGGGPGGAWVMPAGSEP